MSKKNKNLPSLPEIDFPPVLKHWDMDSNRQRYEYEMKRLDQWEILERGQRITKEGDPLAWMLLSNSCGNYWYDQESKQTYDGANGSLRVLTVTITLHCVEFEIVLLPETKDALIARDTANEHSYRVLAVYARDV